MTLFTGANPSTSLSTGTAVTISIIVTLLVSLPVGVVIGLTLPKVVRSCGQGVRRRRRENKGGEEEEGEIYEEPDKMATVIPLSENEAYGLSQNKN